MPARWAGAGHYVFLQLRPENISKITLSCKNTLHMIMKLFCRHLNTNIRLFHEFEQRPTLNTLILIQFLEKQFS